MFGYIRPFKPEMRIKEYETYRSFYCSMCKKLGKNYGVFARFTLNYEFVFLSLLYSSLKNEDFLVKAGRCPFNPAKTCNYCTTEGKALDFSSSAAVMLLYYKLLDNIRDEKGIKKLFFLTIKPFFKSKHKKAVLKYPELDKLFFEYDEKQQSIEREGISDIDIAAEPTAKMLGRLLKMCSDNEKNKLPLERLGYCLGRYIYILDAVSDLEKDKKSGAYNPLKNKNDIADFSQRQLYFCINEATAAFELLEIYKFKNILGNIICLGLEDTFKKETNK